MVGAEIELLKWYESLNSVEKLCVRAWLKGDERLMTQVRPHSARLQEYEIHARRWGWLEQHSCMAG